MLAQGAAAQVIAVEPNEPTASVCAPPRAAPSVLLTHGVRHAAWADRVVFLRDGRVVDEVVPPAGPECLLRSGRVS